MGTPIPLASREIEPEDRQIVIKKYRETFTPPSMPGEMTCRLNSKGISISKTAADLLGEYVRVHFNLDGEIEFEPVDKMSVNAIRICKDKNSAARIGRGTILRWVKERGMDPDKVYRFKVDNRGWLIAKVR